MFVRSFVLAAAMTIAGTPPAPAQTQARAGYDPNEKVCESIPVIGSRLARKRVCASRAEWEEKKRLDREAVEQAQRQIGGPCSTVGNKNTGGPSC
jgi:hypothetical protein